MIEWRRLERRRRRRIFELIKTNYVVYKQLRARIHELSITQ